MAICKQHTQKYGCKQQRVLSGDFKHLLDDANREPNFVQELNRMK